MYLQNQKIVVINNHQRSKQFKNLRPKYTNVSLKNMKH